VEASTLAGRNHYYPQLALPIGSSNVFVFSITSGSWPGKVTGPEGTLSGTIIEDVIVFEDQPYGFYEGYAFMEGNDPVYSCDTLEFMDYDLTFYFLNVGIKENPDHNMSFTVSPNPSSGNVSISFNIEDAGAVSLKVYSQQGQLIQMLAEGRLDAGLHKVAWNRIDDSGYSVKPGAYLVVLKVSGIMESRILIFR
jgi:hypothetical protein